MSEIGLTRLSCGALAGVVLLITACLMTAVVLTNGCAPKDTAVSADGVPIAFQVQGSGTPALVFVHGWCCDKSYWDAQVPYFSKTHKVVTIDLAGHGESGLGREAYAMEAFGEDVVAVVDKLGLDKVVLIGHSMGGPVILEAALRMPGRVTGLIVADMFNNVEQKFQMDELLASLRANFPETTVGFVRSMFTPDADSVLVEKIAADMSSAPPEVGVSAMEELTIYWNNKLTRALRQVQAPVRCINSAMYPSNVEVGQRYASSFEAVDMSGVGHFVMNEDPETFNRLLDQAVAEFVRLAGLE
jgi:pimeloyl-ACP methyl ester carboxylesterase